MAEEKNHTSMELDSLLNAIDGSYVDTQGTKDKYLKHIPSLEKSYTSTLYGRTISKRYEDQNLEALERYIEKEMPLWSDIKNPNALVQFSKNIENILKNNPGQLVKHRNVGDASMMIADEIVDIAKFRKTYEYGLTLSKRLEMAEALFIKNLKDGEEAEAIAIAKNIQGLVGTFNRRVQLLPRELYAQLIPKELIENITEKDRRFDEAIDRQSINGSLSVAGYQTIQSGQTDPYAKIRYDSIIDDEVQKSVNETQNHQSRFALSFGNLVSYKSTFDKFSSDLDEFEYSTTQDKEKIKKEEDAQRKLKDALFEHKVNSAPLVEREIKRLFDAVHGMNLNVENPSKNDKVYFDMLDGLFVSHGRMVGDVGINIFKYGEDSLNGYNYGDLIETNMAKVYGLTENKIDSNKNDYSETQMKSWGKYINDTDVFMGIDDFIKGGLDKVNLDSDANTIKINTGLNNDKITEKLLSVIEGLNVKINEQTDKMNLPKDVKKYEFKFTPNEYEKFDDWAETIDWKQDYSPIAGEFSPSISNEFKEDIISKFGKNSVRQGNIIDHLNKYRYHNEMVAMDNDNEYSKSKSSESFNMVEKIYNESYKNKDDFEQKSIEFKQKKYDDFLQTLTQLDWKTLNHYMDTGVNINFGGMDAEKIMNNFTKYSKSSTSQLREYFRNN